MGGDGGPELVVAATRRFLDDNQDVDITLYGVRDKVLVHFPQGDSNAIPRCRIEHSSQTVEDDELPSAALRHKQNSSMGLAFQAVAEGRASACVSSGNTGAMVAMGLKLMGCHEGVDRPAICATIPARSKSCYLLDVGANVDCSAAQLRQLAAMATAMVSALEGSARPTVALLNIGKESIKGNRVVKEAAELFAGDASLNYLGFIEADELLDGRVDIFVCDGFVGNIALKASEGAVRNVMGRIALIAERHMSQNELHLNGDARQAVDDFSSSLVKGLGQTLDPDIYNGAILLGLRGVAIKSHGNTGEMGFYRALEQAARAAEADVPALVSRQINRSVSR